MKTLKLKALALGSAEVLSREQLKKVSGGGGQDCTNSCGGSTGETCGQGLTCKSVACPNDPSFYHNTCV